MTLAHLPPAQLQTFTVQRPSPHLPPHPPPSSYLCRAFRQRRLQHRRHLLGGEGVGQGGGNDATQDLYCSRLKGALEQSHLLSNNHRAVYYTAARLHYSLLAWLITKRQITPLLYVTLNRRMAMLHSHGTYLLVVRPIPRKASMPPVWYHKELQRQTLLQRQLWPMT